MVEFFFWPGMVLFPGMHRSNSCQGHLGTSDDSICVKVRNDIR